MCTTQQNIQFFHVNETDSTNLAIQRLPEATHRETIYALRADFQTAGRGQKGTSWESERGKNLLFSVMFWPDKIEVRRQFRLSQAMALAICTELNNLAPGFAIKWPNDIYFQEKKVSGTIIETIWRGSLVDRCILGIGINVNQTTFHSDAPNPYSLYQILGRETDIPQLLQSIMHRFAAELQSLRKGGEADMAQRYRDHLIWREGLHTYRDGNGEFQARLADIEPDGHILLIDTEGKRRRYLFKEVKHVFKTLVCE